MKRLLFLVSGIFFLSIMSPKDAVAQNTHNCAIRVSGGTPRCVPNNATCIQGYSPNLEYCLYHLSDCASAPYTPCLRQPYLVCGPNSTSIRTAIGCIPVFSKEELTKFLLQWGIGIGGGVGFLLIVYGGFLITTSSGDPKRLNAGKELISAALMGLILLLFGVYILRIIGVDILGIPGLQ